MELAKRTQSIKNNHNTGFTLVELLLVIALIAISVTVTGDILVSLIRSYNKTNVINEIEQESNFVGQKIEKDLRNATIVTVQNSGTQLSMQTLTGMIYYNYANNNLYRSTTGFSTSANDALVSNAVTTTTIGGVNISQIGAAQVFELLPGTPQVVNIKMRFNQAQASPVVSFEGEVQLINTIVIRNSY